LLQNEIIAATRVGRRGKKGPKTTEKQLAREGLRTPPLNNRKDRYREAPWLGEDPAYAPH